MCRIGVKPSSAVKKRSTNCRPGRQSARSVRIFISSTFRDFGEERDLLVRQLFPALRSRLKDRCVELVDVDLRWGISHADAENGAVLGICLEEIERARPYFIGMLGERYGWVPKEGEYAADLLARQPWLKAFRGDKSITELEILHGVLNNPAMAGRAMFCFRSPRYAQAKGGHYVSLDPADRERLRDLKQRIRRSGFPVVRYRDPMSLLRRLERDLWRLLEAQFPATEVPDAFEREGVRHEAHAVRHRRLFLGGDAYLRVVDRALATGKPWLLIHGDSGAGKSALIANWIAAHRAAEPRDRIHQHFLGASADASDPVVLVRRMIECIARTTGSALHVEADPEDLLRSLPGWLQVASAWVGKRKARWIFALDSLNSLAKQRDLRWLPDRLPARVHFLISCLSGDVMVRLEQALPRKESARVHVKPMHRTTSQALLVQYLRTFHKSLPRDVLRQVLRHKMVRNPLFLRTMAEELRLFGAREALPAQVQRLLRARSLAALFGRVLERVERDCGKARVRSALTAIWASRAGLSESEILGFAGLVPATWAPIRHALDEALLEAGGRITFAHDFLRRAIHARYLPSSRQRRAAHRALAEWFTKRLPDSRRVEEEPYQWRQAHCWLELRKCLTDRAMFTALCDHLGLDGTWEHWMALEQNSRARTETELAKAWRRWRPTTGQRATGELADHVGGLLATAGRYGDFTEQMHRLVVTIDRRCNGPRSEATSASLGNLALLLHTKGDLAGAEKLCRQALATAIRGAGPKSHAAATCFNNLGGILVDKGGPAEARRAYQQALDVMREVLGDEHPDVATALINLAALHHSEGEFARSASLLRRALSIRERVHGPEHPETGTCLNNLALALKDCGHLVRAEAIARKALAIAERVHGPWHPHTATTLSNLALILDERRRAPLTSEHLFRRAIAIEQRAFGCKHPQTGAGHMNLGLSLMEKRMHGAAEPELRLAIRALATEKSAGSDKCANSMKALAECLFERGRKREGRAQLLQASRRFRRADPSDQEGLVSCLVALGESYGSSGHYSKAAKHLAEAVAMARNTPNRLFSILASGLLELAHCRFRQGKYAEAHALLAECLERSERRGRQEATFCRGLRGRLREVERCLRPRSERAARH